MIGADGGGRGIGDASGRSVHSGRSPVGAAEWKEIARGRTQRGGAQGAGKAGGGDETRESPLGMPSSHGAAKRAGTLLRSWGEEGGGGGSGGWELGVIFQEEQVEEAIRRRRSHSRDHRREHQQLERVARMP